MAGDEARADGWRPIDDEAKSGEDRLLWCVHANARWSADPRGEGWEAAVIGKWIDHNGGGWTWHGLCGQIVLWRPIEPPAETLSALQQDAETTQAGEGR